MLLDSLAPAYDVSARHRIWIAAPAEHVYDVARAMDLGRPWLVRVLMAVRVLPALPLLMLRAARAPGAVIRGGRTGAVCAVPFTLVAEAPGQEFVLGIVGRFWTLTGGVVPAGPDQFRQPPPAGLAQAFWNFHVAPSGNGTALSTETRVRCGDEATRRSFMKYWGMIRVGSGLIRRSMLRHIRAAAESGAVRVQPSS